MVNRRRFPFWIGSFPAGAGLLTAGICLGAPPTPEDFSLQALPGFPAQWPAPPATPRSPDKPAWLQAAEVRVAALNRWAQQRQDQMEVEWEKILVQARGEQPLLEKFRASGATEAEARTAAEEVTQASRQLAEINRQFYRAAIMVDVSTLSQVGNPVLTGERTSRVFLPQGNPAAAAEVMALFDADAEIHKAREAQLPAAFYRYVRSWLAREAWQRAWNIASNRLEKASETERSALQAQLAILAVEQRLSDSAFEVADAQLRLITEHNFFARLRLVLDPAKGVPLTRTPPPVPALAVLTRLDALFQQLDNAYLAAVKKSVKQTAYDMKAVFLWQHHTELVQSHNRVSSLPFATEEELQGLEEGVKAAIGFADTLDQQIETIAGLRESSNTLAATAEPLRRQVTTLRDQARTAESAGQRELAFDLRVKADRADREAYEIGERARQPWAEADSEQVALEGRLRNRLFFQALPGRVVLQARLRYFPERQNFIGDTQTVVRESKLAAPAVDAVMALALTMTARGGPPEETERSVTLDAGGGPLTLTARGLYDTLLTPPFVLHATGPSPSQGASKTTGRDPAAWQRVTGQWKISYRDAQLGLVTGTATIDAEKFTGEVNFSTTPDKPPQVMKVREVRSVENNGVAVVLHGNGPAAVDELPQEFAWNGQTIDRQPKSPAATVLLPPIPGGIRIIDNPGPRPPDFNLPLDPAIQPHLEVAPTATILRIKAGDFVCELPLTPRPPLGVEPEFTVTLYPAGTPPAAKPGSPAAPVPGPLAGAWRQDVDPLTRRDATGGGRLGSFTRNGSNPNHTYQTGPELWWREPAKVTFQLLAQTVEGPVKVARLFYDVPTVIEAVFEEPQLDKEQELTLSLGGKELTLTAKRDPYDYRRFVTGVIVPASASNATGGQNP